MALSFKAIGQGAPPVEHCPTGLKQHTLSRLGFETACRDFQGDGLGTRPGMRRLPAQHCTVNAVPLCNPALSSNSTFRGIGLDTEITKVLGEVLAPLDYLLSLVV